MRQAVFVLVMFFVAGCVSTQKLERNPEGILKVAVNAQQVKITSHTSTFSEDTRQNVLSTGFVDSVGQEILGKVVLGYVTFTEGFEYTSNVEEAGVEIRIDHLEIRRGYITLNIPHPGPIYKVTMYVSVFKDGLLTQSLSYSGRANMAQVNFPDDIVHWMSFEEKEKPEYQLNTLNKALRSIYQQLYFNLFDIRL